MHKPTSQQKLYISAQSLLEDSFKLAVKIYKSGFRPDFIVGIWRGGSPVGIAIQEFLDYIGVNADHIAIRTASYRGIGERDNHVRVFGLNYIIDNIKTEQTLLMVDDVYDTGLSIHAALAELRAKTPQNYPHDVRIAVPWFKPANNRTDRMPDYFVHTTDRWLVFPHELKGLSREEIESNKPGLKAVFAELEG